MKTLDLKSLLIGVLLTMLIVSFILLATNDSAPRAWEYKSVSSIGSGIGPELTKLGDEGWEVVGYTFSKYPNPGHGSDYSHYILKRPKERHWNWKLWR